MALYELLETTNVPLDTDAIAVTAPTGIEKVKNIVLSAESGGSLVVWERQKAVDSTYSKFVPASETSIEISLNPGQTPFFAKVTSGTATLDVEWWG